MKHIYAILILFLAVTLVQAKKANLQQENELLKQKIEQIQTQTSTQQETLQHTEQQTKDLLKEVESLRISLSQQADTSQKETKYLRQELDVLARKISDSSVKTYQTIDQVNKQMTEEITRQQIHINLLQNSGKKYSYFAWILLLILLGITIWVVLKIKKFSTAISWLTDQIQKNKDDMSRFLQEQINLCHQLLENNHRSSEDDQPIDFSLALKVADEITLMERNMSFMDSSVKGFKQLKRSIETLKDKLNMLGYEMPELLGKKFNSGMKLTVVSSFPTDQLPTGAEIISKIIKPQVNYQGKMIQAAQVEVSIGE